MKFFLQTVALQCLLSTTMMVQGQDRLDRFTYGETESRGDGWTDYGPPDWGDINCNENNRQGVDNCLAYIDKWHTGRDWAIRDNYCLWCPAGTNRCGRHHQSPINLNRDRAIAGNPNEKECIDVHWMKYEDSFCSLDQLRNLDAFTIERHALRVTQPLTVFNNNDLRLECFIAGVGRRFGRIDYSKGFSQWWFLSHIDFHVPSEHHQEGKQYDGEIQLKHFYSVPFSESNVNNEMGTVSVFLEAYEDAAPYRYLDKVICLWRRYEYRVRAECGLPSVTEQYPGCFPITRKERRKMESMPVRRHRHQFHTAEDVIMFRDQHKDHVNGSALPNLVMEETNWDDAEDKDWDAFIEEQSAQMKLDEERWAELHSKHKNNTDDAHEAYRNLLGEEEIPWFNYFPMLGVRTEYYYRYSGSQTIPPCYGNFQPDSRKETNHWRVLKDPIRIHPRQLKEMKRLIAQRVAPIDDPVNACNADTAAHVTPDGDIESARPLQYFHPAHFKTFCECQDWRSKWPEDREWCDIDDINERFYEHPYNFEHEGF